MATVYTTTASIAATGIAAISSSTLSKAVTAAGEDVFTGTQDIGIASELLVIPAEIPAATTGAIMIKNLDVTNFVEFGFANPVVTGVACVRLDAGCFALLPRPASALYGIATGGTVKVQVWAVEL